MKIPDKRSSTLFSSALLRNSYDNDKQNPKVLNLQYQSLIINQIATIVKINHKIR